MSGWRVGNRVSLNVYLNDAPMFQCHTPEDAAMVVALLNAPMLPRAVSLLKASTDRLHAELCDGCDCEPCKLDKEQIAINQAFLAELEAQG